MMIARVLWWAFNRAYPTGITPAMLDGIDQAIREYEA